MLGQEAEASAAAAASVAAVVVVVVVCVTLRAFIVACDRHETGQRSSEETDSSRRLQRARSRRGNVAALLTAADGR